MSLGGNRKPSPTQSMDSTSDPGAGKTIDLTGDGGGGGAPAAPAAPAANADPLASDATRKSLDEAAAVERKARGRSSTFLSIGGDTSGKSVSRRTLLGA